MTTKALKFKWTISKVENTYGYNICSLWVDDKKVSSCNGDGYDMEGTVLGNYIAYAFADKLMKLTEPCQFGNLTYHNPNWKPTQDTLDKEQAGESFGLERYQDFYKQSSKVPTEVHTIPMIDGTCGFSTVTQLMEKIGLTLKRIDKTTNSSIYLLEEA